MNTGDKVVLTDNTIVVDAYGTDYLLKGTEGIVKENRGDMLAVETAKGVYDVPAASAEPVPADQAA
jgi:hypothetical protein